MGEKTDASFRSRAVQVYEILKKGLSKREGRSQLREFLGNTCSDDPLSPMYRCQS